MTTICYTDAGVSVRLGSELGRGGEGAILEVEGTPSACAKIYSKKVSAEYHRKLQRMVENPPADPAFAANNHRSIAWPDVLLYSDKRRQEIVGFTMPKIDVKQFKKALSYTDPGDRLKLFQGGLTWRHLFTSGYNIASAVAAIHERGYCIGDFNESNVVVAPTALITLLDCDSFQVPDPKQGTTYRCPVGKPEYTAPELQGKSFRDHDRTVATDSFALAVMLFQLLMEGTHPYQAKGALVADAPNTAAKIVKGHFPYGASVKGLAPPDHAPPFDILPPEIQQLFVRCFAQGHKNPGVRPTALEWFQAMGKLKNKFHTCAVNDHHVFLDPLGTCACPWCGLLKKTGKDLFPSAIGQQIGLLPPSPKPPRSSSSTSSLSKPPRSGSSSKTSTSTKFPKKTAPTVPDGKKRAVKGAALAGGLLVCIAILASPKSKKEDAPPGPVPNQGAAVNPQNAQAQAPTPSPNVNTAHQEALTQAMMLVQQGEYDKAMPALTEGCQTDREASERALAHVYLARALNKTGKHDEAVKHCDESLRLVATTDAFAERAAAWLARGDYPKAMDDSNKAQTQAQTQAIAIKASGYVYRNVAALWPPDAQAVIHATALCYQRQYDDAIARCQYGPSAEAFNVAGIAFANKGDYESAIRCYQQAIQRNAQLHAAYFNLAVATGGISRRYDPGLAERIKASRLDPQNVWTFDDVCPEYTRQAKAAAPNAIPQIDYGGGGAFFPKLPGPGGLQPGPGMMQANPKPAAEAQLPPSPLPDLKPPSLAGLMPPVLIGPPPYPPAPPRRTEGNPAPFDAPALPAPAFSRPNKFGNPPFSNPPFGNPNPQGADETSRYYGSTGNYAKAVELFTDLIQRQQGFMLAYFNRAWAYTKLSVPRTKEAIDDYDQVLKLDGKFAPAYYYRGLARLKERDYLKAIADFTSALELDQKQTSAYLDRALAYTYLKSDKAEGDFAKAKDVGPQAPQVYFDLGVLAFQRGSFAEAVTHFNKALTMDSKFVVAHQALGMAYERIENYASARKAYSEALQYDPNCAAVLVLHGRGLELKKNSEALKYYAAAVQADANLALAHLALGHARANQIGASAEDVKIAIADIDKAVGLDPKNTEALLYRALAFYRLSNFTRALKDCDDLIESNPGHSMAHLIKGLVYRKQENQFKALEECTLAIKADPKNSSAYAERGDAYAYKYITMKEATKKEKQDFEDKALKDFAEAIQLDANNPYTYVKRGDLYRRLAEKKATEAVKDFDKAIELEKNPMFYLKRALAKGWISPKGFPRFSELVDPLEDKDLEVRAKAINVLAYLYSLHPYENTRAAQLKQIAKELEEKGKVSIPRGRR